MMQDNGKQPICDLCLDYISGVCTDEERLSFELHLPGCADCQAEIDELRIVWEALPSDMERIEPPIDLKKQVMDAVMAGETETYDVKPARKRYLDRWQSSVIAAVVVALFIAGSVWNFQLYRERTTAPVPLEQALSVSATHIEQFIPLKPQLKELSDSYAVACIIDNGQSKQFVVYVVRAEATRGEAVYQVWLNHDGNRQSAGTFRVNNRGIGVLAMPITSDNLTFDTIGITLEPDDRGDHPRGTKIFGSI